MTANPDRRKRTTVVAFVGTVVLVLLAGALFTVGVLTLSNSEEGEAVGVDDRPASALPATPNALLAVTDSDDELSSVVVLTLLPEGVGGSIVVVPVTADSTAAFGSQRRPLDDVFSSDDPEAFAEVVEEMLAITIERVSIVDGDELGDLIGLDSAGDGIEVGGDAFWADLAATAPVDDDVDVPVDDQDLPVPPVDTAELVSRLFAGQVDSRSLAAREPTPSENPTDAEVVIIDRRDANLVFAQVSPALVSTPNTGLTMRIVAPYSDEQIDASDGRFESTSELMVKLIGQVLFFQANVVSADTQPVGGGAAEVTVIEVTEERFVEDMEDIARIVFGESEVRLATSVIEGIDVVVVLGTDYIAKQIGESPAGPDADTSDTSVPTGDTVESDD